MIKTTQHTAMKKLSQLLLDITPLEVIGETDRNITSVASDSRRAEKDGLFVAVKGTLTDGHKYIPVVASNHVGAIVCEELPSSYDKGVTYIRVADSAEALGKLASAWYDHPSERLSLTGVTGTNGKTTTATLLYEMARLEGHKAGLLSTVCNYIDNVAEPTTHTTPDPLTLNALLARMVEAGCTYAFMEVSSHAADQKRIAGLKFSGALFSNLTRDHLDYHGTVENYRDAKKSFFDMLGDRSFALVNADDKSGMYMLQNTKARKFTYSLTTDADFRGRILENYIDGTLMTFNSHEAHVTFAGRFNAYNLLCVYGASILLGFDPEHVLVNMTRLVPVAGRFQPVRSAKGVTAVIDYAHTPDALVNVLDTLRDIVRPTGGRIITVVGAGGNRDKGKRPIMAKVSAQRSDILLLTSDNPRYEAPDDIIADMCAGLDNPDDAECITDRRQAIRHACELATPADVILIAGKGHENYQDVEGVKHHFDDREEVEEAFRIIDSSK